MKVGLLIIPDALDENIKWDHNVDYSKSLHIEDEEHEFRTWHSYAAATKGMAMVYGMDGWERIYECDMVIVAVFSNVYEAVGPIMELKDRGKVVALAYHEGLQMLQYIIARDIQYMAQFYNIASISGCDFVLFSTPRQTGLFWRAMGAFENVPVHYVPFAYPMNIRKNYIVPVKERNGIFIGYSDPSTSLMKNSLMLLLVASHLAKKHDTFVTIIANHCDYHEWFVDEGGKNRLIVIKPGDYHKFLGVLSHNQICISLDTSLCQGQMSFDAAMVGIPCIGGSTDGQGILYKELAFDTTNLNKIIEMADRCLSDDMFYNKKVSYAEFSMFFKCSFDAVSNQLLDLYKRYKGKTT